MVGVVDPTARIDHDFGILGKDRIRPERPDLADEKLAQDEVVDQGAVRLMQEAHPGVAYDFRRSALLMLAQLSQSNGICVRVLAALVAAGAADQPADGCTID